MNGPIRRVALGLFIAFLVLALDVTYWQIIAADRLREDPRNERVLLARSGRERGQIISSDAEVLARSVPDPSDPRRYVREYPHASLYAHVVGFSSRLFGDIGLEADYADLLTSGRDLTVSGIVKALLGDDPRAHSMQLSLSHKLQETAARALGDRPGAVVAIEPATGGVLVMVSSPSFDPNSLIEEAAAGTWEALAEDAARPLSNRASGTSLLEAASMADLLAVGGLELAATRQTAVELAMRAATVAGDGLLMTPYLVARVLDGDSALGSETEPSLRDPPFSAEAANALREGMEPLVIESALLGYIQGLGEVGSGEDQYGRRRNWFVGFVPVDEPVIAIAVVVEPTGSTDEDGAGASVTIPIGRAVVTAWLDQQAPDG